MQYKLHKNSRNNNSDLTLVERILANRGIKDTYTYLHLTKDVEIPYTKLKHIEKAIECFDYHYQLGHKIGILWDTDVDGKTSGSAMYNYIKKLNPNYNVVNIIHTRNKAHGLSNDITIPGDIDLLIIPDAASNDVEQCKELKKNGIDIIILDHHEIETENIYAIVVNNQDSEEYENKSLSGVGVVYKFLQGLDELYWVEYADEFLDLVALGLIGDCMDIRSFETKYLIQKGLENISKGIINPAFKALIDAQEYSTKGIINIHTIQWYIVPIINAMIRIGTADEIDLIVKAFSQQYEVFEYNKRKTKSSEAMTIEENIYDRFARMSKNAKSRQDKLREKSANALIEKINLTEEDKIIIVDGTEVVDSGLTGVIAMKICDKFKKPIVLLNKFTEKETIIDNDGNEKIISKTFFGGSSRNFNHSPIEDLKLVLNESKTFVFANGHPNACGVKLELDKVDLARQTLNNMLKDIKYESTYYVDFIFKDYELSIADVVESEIMNDLVGQNIEDITMAIEDITVRDSDITLRGSDKNTIAFVNSNGIEFVMFSCKENNEFFKWASDDSFDHTDNTMVLNFVGKPGINDFNGTKTPQFVIDDFEIIKTYNTEVNELEDDDEVW